MALSLRCAAPAAEPSAIQINGTSSASADVMQLFSKAQRNLMEVNRSRLDALQELGAAQARIAELGTGSSLLQSACCWAVQC